MKLIQLKTGEWIALETITGIKVFKREEHQLPSFEVGDVPDKVVSSPRTVIFRLHRDDYLVCEFESESEAQAYADDLARQVNRETLEPQGIAGMSDDQLKEALKELRQHARINETDRP